MNWLKGLKWHVMSCIFNSIVALHLLEMAFIHVVIQIWLCSLSTSANRFLRCASSTMWHQCLWNCTGCVCLNASTILVHHCLNGASPQYLCELIQLLSDVDSRCWLRSASTAEVLLPATQHTNPRRPCFCHCRSTCLEQSSSRSAPIPDIFYFQNTKSHLFNISFPSVWLNHWLFLYRAT